MRTLMMAAAVASMASAADAQRVSARGPAMARPMARPAPMARPGPHVMGRPAGGGHYGHPTPKPPKPAPGGWQRPGHGWQGGHNGGWSRPNPVRPGWGGHGVRPPRWGNRVQGRWWAGWRAPGGWGAYRRPVRGWVLPSFWISPSWYINDWASYGLATPPAGYTWSPNR
jgi:Ni/Co efflux regulator RcnB